MKINIISFYCPPEKGAASNRIWNLAVNLKERGFDVAILCPHPNYPTGKVFEGYGKSFINNDWRQDIRIRRHWLYPSNSKSGVIRMLSMLSFSFSLFFSIPFLRKRKANYTIVNSPPLFTGLAGVIIAKIVKSKAVLNVSDIWPLSALELGAMKKGKLYSALEFLERKMYKKADSFICQSEETKRHIEKIQDSKEIVVYRNLPVINESYIQPYYCNEKQNLRIVYAGLLGVAQGIAELIQQIDFNELGVELHIYGDGNEKEQVLSYLESNPECNIYYHGFISVEELDEIMPTYHVSLIPLKKPIYGAFPSKIFTALKMGLPVLFSGEGEGAKFVIENEIGLINASDDYNQLKNNIKSFRKLSAEEYNNLSLKCRSLMLDKYNQEDQVNLLINKILINNEK